MTTAEAKTISMVNSLSEQELFRVEKKVRALAETRRREKYLPKMSGDEIATVLKESYQQSLRGDVYSEEVVQGEIRAILEV